MFSPVTRVMRAYALPLSLAGHLAACSTGPFATGDDEQLAELSAGMQRCLEQQAQTNQQLEGQSALLASQQASLAVLESRVDATHREPQPMEVATATVITEQACDAPPADSEPPSTAKLLVGELEEVWLDGLEMALPARIDTGAETASLDARNIEVFERDGRRWVRFEILHPVTGEPVPMERRLKRMVSIIQSNSPEPERRPVIKLGITIGHISQTAEFTLSDRSHLDYQVLVGRNILQDVMVVDVSRKNAAPYQLPDMQEPGP